MSANLQDLTDLVSILSNPDLAVELRRSAAEQLLALSGEPTLLPSLSSPLVLATALRSAAVASGLSCLPRQSVTSSSGPLGDLHTGFHLDPDLSLGRSPDLGSNARSRMFGGSVSSSVAQGGLEPPALDVLSSLEVQLPMACMNLLYAVAARSVVAREWLMNEGAEVLQHMHEHDSSKADLGPLKQFFSLGSLCAIIHRSTRLPCDGQWVS